MLLRIPLQVRLYLIGMIWLGWVVFVSWSPSSPWRLLDIIASDLLGAVVLHAFYRQAPKAMQAPLWGLTCGMYFITLADILILPGEHFLNVFFLFDPYTGYISLVGLLFVLVGSLTLPYTMEQQGLYPAGRSAVLMGISAVVSSFSLYFLTSAKQLDFLEAITQALVVLVFMLYLLQSFLVGGGRIGKQIQVISIALTLINVGRIIAIAGDWQLIYQLTYEALWLLGITVLVLFAPRKNK